MVTTGLSKLKEEVKNIKFLMHDAHRTTTGEDQIQSVTLVTQLTPKRRKKIEMLHINFFFFFCIINLLHHVDLSFIHRNIRTLLEAFLGSSKVALKRILGSNLYHINDCQTNDATPCLTKQKK